MLRQLVAERWLTANAVIGFWPAATSAMTISGFTRMSAAIATRARCTRCASRSAGTRQNDRANTALADFIAPESSGVADYIGGFAVTAGIGEAGVAERFQRANDDYSKIMVKALADRLAEALAEHMHARVRREFWAYAPDETLTQDDLIS